MVCARARRRWRHPVFDGVVFCLTWLLLATSPAVLHAQTPAAGVLSPSASDEAADEKVDAKLRALLDVLEDEQARAELIDQLHALTGEAAASETAPAPMSLARQVAMLTRDAAEEASALISRIWDDVGGFGAALSGGVDVQKLLTEHADLISVVVATFLVLIVLRLLRRPLIAPMAALAEGKGVLGRALWMLGAVLIDAVAVLLAYASGHGLALTLFGELGRIDVDQSLFLNGFLLVELAKAALRGLISPRSKDLRLLPISDRTAAFAYRRSSTIASTIGYGALVVAPLVNVWISIASGRAVSVFVHEPDLDPHASRHLEVESAPGRRCGAGG